jgi:hypothetical protein
VLLESETVGAKVGTSVGALVGAMVLVVSVGMSVGRSEGAAVDASVGATVGAGVGLSVYATASHSAMIPAAWRTSVGVGDCEKAGRERQYERQCERQWVSRRGVKEVRKVHHTKS